MNKPTVFKTAIIKKPRINHGNTFNTVFEILVCSAFSALFLDCLRTVTTVKITANAMSIVVRVSFTVIARFKSKPFIALYVASDAATLDVSLIAVPARNPN